MLRHAIARLVATPIFTIFSIVSLGAGVAVTTAVYSVVRSLFADDLGVPDPDNVAFVVEGGGPQYALLSPPDFEDLKAADRSFGAVAASATTRRDVATSTTAEVLAVEAVDGAYFATLGIRAQRGRVVQPDDVARAARIVVLSDELWRRRFDAKDDAIGRTIRIDGQPFEVVGVADARYRGVFGVLRSTRLWIPLSADRMPGEAESSPRAAREDRRLVVVGRVPPNVGVNQASAEVATVGLRLDRAYPAAERGKATRAGSRSWSVRSVAARHGPDDTDRRVGMTLVALVALVLVVACTNLANLVLARGIARQGGLAVRMALGASRTRLVFEECVECLMLAGAGMLTAFAVFRAVAAAATREYTLGAGAVRVAFAIHPTLDLPALGFTFVSTALALAVFGIEPAVQLTRTSDLRSVLAAHAGGLRPRLGRQRMIIRWQVAIAAAFFIVATMFIRATIQLARHDSGIDLDHVAVAAVDFRGGTWDEARIQRTIDRIVEEARGHSTVTDVSASTGLPFGVLPAIHMSIARADDPVALSQPPIDALAVTTGFFKTLGIPIVRGRGFDDRDATGGQPVVIVSQLTARRLFSTTDPIGRTIVMRTGGRGAQAIVVGVARDTDVNRIDATPRPLAYVPLTQQFARALTIVARSPGGAGQAVSALREALRRVDPGLGVDAIGTGRATLAGSYELLQDAGVAALSLGGFTLLLSMIGLFGVQSHLVAHRTREIGVRMSLGATPAQIKRMVVKDGYRPVVEGLLLGLWGGVAGRAIVRAYMDLHTGILDPWMFAITPIPLVLAALCACYMPAARAAAIEPVVALRAE